MTTKKVLGVDVSASSVTVHVLENYPKGGLKNYWEKTRNKAALNYPSFFSNPSKRNQKTAWEFAEFVESELPSLAILEPTGNHYSLLWARILDSLGVDILWVGHVELRRYRAGKLLPNKSDPADALAMCAYALDEDNHTESGDVDLRKYLLHRPDDINQIRECCQQINHLSRVQSPIINYSRQMLAWQFPEVAKTDSTSSKVGNLPPLWGWLAQQYDRVDRGSVTRLDNKYVNSVAVKYGLEISPFLRSHALWLCQIQDLEFDIDSRLRSLLENEKFLPYMRIFDDFGFGLRVRARILSRIYPFESFLKSDGRVWVEHETREVKRTERNHTDGVTTIKRSAGDTKRTKRNRSRDMFKMRLGMGTTLEQSGDALVEKPSGSSICRMSLWQYVICQLETGKLPDSKVAAELILKRDELKSQVNAQGDKLLNGRHIQGKLMAKVANMLFIELVTALAVR